MPHTLTRQLSRAHATELGKALPTEPVVFSKSPACMVPPGGEIVLPSVEECVDYEGELVVVIGDRSLLSAPSLAPSIEKEGLQEAESEREREWGVVVRKLDR